MSSSQTLEIESSDVIRLILQFLKENNLNRSLQTLQEESRVTLDSVESVDQLVADIQHGRWEIVLQVISTATLPENIIHTLYEQVVLELLELQEFELGGALMRETAALQSLKLVHPERFKKLQQLSKRSFVDSKELYEGLPKETRRGTIAQMISTHLQPAPRSRLITLIGMALKWQQHQGIIPPGDRIDLFRNTTSKGSEQLEECPQHVAKTIRFGQKTHPECAVFSPDGQYLVSGSVDGFIEVWNWITGKLSLNLAYQKNEDLMMHEEAVLAVAFSKDSEILATGGKTGQLKVWKIVQGTCVRKFEKAHNAAISSICFSRDSLQLLTASFDHTARVHGLKSGKTLKEFRGHASYVNSAIYSSDGSNVITASSDGKVKIWDSRTAECIRSFSPPPPFINTGLVPSINCVFHASQSAADLIFVCTRSPTIYLMNLSGQVIKTYSSGKREKGDFVAATVSPRGEWIYCVGEDSTLYCFCNSSGKLEHVLKVHVKEAIGLAHHPQHNVLASWGADGCLNLLKP